MRTLYYAIIGFFILLMIHECYVTYTTLKEGMVNNDAELWKNNHHNIGILDKRLHDLESLEYIRKNNPEVLGARVNDDSLTINDVIQYFKSGVHDNKLMIDDITTQLATAIPKEEDINISGL